MTRPNKFATFLKVLLIEKDLSQASLAQKIGIDPASLSRIMGGRRKPTKRLALAISETLHLSQEEKALLLEAVEEDRKEEKSPASPKDATLSPARRLALGFTFGAPVISSKEERTTLELLEELLKHLEEMREVVQELITRERKLE